MGAVRGWGEGGGLSGACLRPSLRALEGDLYPCQFLQEASGWGGASCVLTWVSRALGCEVLTPSLKGRTSWAMGASLVKGRDHEPRTAALQVRGQ